MLNKIINDYWLWSLDLLPCPSPIPKCKKAEKVDDVCDSIELVKNQNGRESFAHIANLVFNF